VLIRRPLEERTLEHKSNSIARKAVEKVSVEGLNVKEKYPLNVKLRVKVLVNCEMSDNVNYLLMS
jgi:hypothetical protein